MTEIKPCPHCGAHLELAVAGECAGYWFHPGVVTDWDCVTSGRGFLPEQIPAWNQRVPDPSVITGLREARLRLAEIEGAGAAIVGLLDSEEWLRTAEGLDAVLSDCRTTAAHLDTLLAGDKS